MKIGILTYHFARNYGAVLQCYALVQHLSAAGHDVSVIDYRPRVLEKGYKVFDIRRFWGRTPARFFKKTARELSVIADRKKRFDSFESFLQDSFRLVPACEISSFDLVIVGSDQVWNTKLTEGHDRLYWGNFSTEGMIASYAASFGDLGCIDKNASEDLFKRNFSCVSFREESALNAFPDVPGARVDIDPVFLPDRSLWGRLADSSGISIGSPYLLLYLVKPSDEARFFAREEAEKRGLGLVVLSAKLEMENSAKVAAASPADFVRLFHDADYIVTTSFHGSAFSIIFGKEFRSFNASGDSRIPEMLASKESLDRRRTESINYLASLTR